MKIAVLDAATLGEDLSLAPLSEFGEVRIYESTAPEDVKKHLSDCEIAVVNKIKLNESNLSENETLRLICIAATGYDNVDVEYCRRKGIGVCNVVGYSSASVSQFTVAAALSLSTNLNEFCQYVNSGEYTARGVANCLTPVYHEISGKTWGIVGLGNIGKSVARVAYALGCRVIAYKRTKIPDCECVDIDTLCRESDIISLHTPLNEGTRGLIDGRRLEMMKRDAILINAARGAVLDERAVADAVKSGKIAGFATDVYVAEPLNKASPLDELRGMSNVIMTPHMAWGAYEARQRCLSEICANIRGYFGNNPRNLL